MHLAEFNIAKWKIPSDSTEARDFFSAIARVNQVAEDAPGFVWRLTGEGDDATDIDAFDDTALLVNMSVWDGVEALEKYVWQTVHQRVYAKKDKWFEAMQSHHFVMWWIEEGHIPTLEEAKERLAYLDRHGNSDHAFDWAHLEHIKLWQTQRCG